MGIFVTDFDGTLTKHDFYQLVRERLLPPGSPNHWADFLAGRISHFEGLRRYFADIRADPAVVEQLLADMQLEPRLVELARALDARGWRIIVASAGCEWYIRRLLEPTGLPLEVHANPGQWQGPDQGLAMFPPTDSPYYSPDNGIDKEAIVADALRQTERVAFAGDGRTDVRPALRVAPQRRFARLDCARQLSELGEPFRSFDRWADVAEALLDERP